MGTSLNPKNIKEGDDVYFECNVRANPRAYRLTWFHEVLSPLLPLLRAFSSQKGDKNYENYSREKERERENANTVKKRKILFDESKRPCKKKMEERCDNFLASTKRTK